MTIQVDSRITEAVLTDGVSKRFDFNFPLFKGDDDQGLEVRFVNDLGYDVVDREDYSLVVGLENKGGHVLFHVAPEAGLSLVIAGKTPLDQSLDITNPGKFFAQSVERSLDKITSMIQEFVSTLDEETRQRINNDKDLRERLDTRFAELAASIDQRFQGKWTEMSDYLNSLLPMFFCIMRKEIEAFTNEQLPAIIDQRFNEVIEEVRADAQVSIDEMVDDLTTQTNQALSSSSNATTLLNNVTSELNEKVPQIDSALSKAEIAANAIAVSGNVFDTPDAGVDPVTGVADGDYFNVRSSSDESYIDEYQNVGGSAVATGKSYPSSQALNEVKQKQVEQEKEIAKIAVKFLTAVDAGLVIWPEMKQPPYSQKDYDDAYNNSINLVRALERLNNEGYSKVVMQRFSGVLPTCYSNLSGSSFLDLLRNSCHAILTGTSNLEVDGNGNTIAVIFDSNNRSPYDKSTMQPYELRGVVIGLQHNTNLNIHSFELVGDQYTRSWVPGERETEQTYGIFMGINNINTKIDIVGRGFRGDAVSGVPRGLELYRLDNNWSSGGLNLTTGAEIVEAGSYKSPRMDLQGKTIYRNSVQIYTTGVLRAAEFRNDLLGVFFYDASGNFISTEKARQCDFIYLPVNCRYIQFVAYEDERTDSTVGYGIYLQLVTGSSDIAEVKGEYYANHRGAVSNLCGNTTVDAFIHDNGTTKYGFPHYGDPTRYGVNFEDIFVSKLTVKGTIQNGIQAILCNARTLNVDATIRNIQFSAIAAYSTFEVNAIGCEIDNVGNVIGAQKTSARKKGRLINFHSNTVKNSRIYGDYSDNPDVLLSIRGNTWAHSSAQLIGSGSNLVFDDNIFTSVSSRYVDVMDVRGALSAKGNSVIRSNNVPNSSKGWGYIGLAGVNAGLNLISIEQNNQRLIFPKVANEVPKMRGVEIIFNGNSADLTPVRKEGVFIDHVDNRRIENCILNGGFLKIGDAANYTSLCTSNLVISGSEFKNGFHLANSRRETVTISNDTLLIKNTLIDLTNSTYLLRNYYALTGTLTVQFINCKFVSDTPKSISLIQGQTSNIVSQAIGCRFINVTNTDGMTTVS